MKGLKENYEPIPDAEQGIGASAGISNPYADLNLTSDQTALMASLDSAIESSSFQLDLGAIDPSELSSRGQSFLLGILAPTIASAATFATALYLQQSAHYNDFVASHVIPYFGYVNAVIMFLSTVFPIQQRLMDAIQPVFVKVESATKHVDQVVGEIGPNVDERIDDIQARIITSLEPIQPTLDQAQEYAAPLSKLDPSLEVPNVKDIDAEFDNAQGVVGNRIEEARQQIEVDPYIPKVLKSSKAFYWRIVVPVLAVALLGQLALCVMTNSFTTATKPPPANNSTSTTFWHHRHLSSPMLRGNKVIDKDDAVDSIKEHTESKVGDYKDEATDAVNQANTTLNGYKNQTNQYKEQVSDTANQYKDQAESKVSDYKDEASAAVNQYTDHAQSTLNGYKNQTSEYKDQAESKLNDYKDQASSTVNQYKDQAQSTLNEYKNQANEYKEQLNSTVQDYKNQFDSTMNSTLDKVDSIIVSSRSMVTNVATSYLMSLLQLALVFVFTNKRVKAFFVKKAIDKVTEEVMRTLRQYGVLAAIEDIFGNKMGRVRAKLLKIFKSVAKIKELLEKIPGAGMAKRLEKFSSQGQAAASAISKVTNGNDAATKAMSSLTKGSESVANSISGFGKGGFGKKFGSPFG